MRVQPDTPELCRFWLAGIIHGLGSSDLLCATRHCTVLLGFLWTYTWAAVPKPHRKALHGHLERLFSKPARDETVVQRGFWRQIMVVAAIIKTDPALYDSEQQDEETTRMKELLAMIDDSEVAEVAEDMMMCAPVCCHAGSTATACCCDVEIMLLLVDSASGD